MKMVLDFYSKLAEGKVEEAEELQKKMLEYIEKSATFNAIYERLVRMPKEFLAYTLAHVFIFIPNSIDMLEAIEVNDTEMVNEFAKRNAMLFAKLFFGGKNEQIYKQWWDF